MKTKMAFLLLAGMGAAAPAWAETYTCDECTKAQRDGMAIQKLRGYSASARGARPYLYLADMSQGKIYKYEYHVTVTTVPGSGDGDTTETKFWATELPVESDVAAGINKVKLALKSGRHIHDTTGTDMPSTVYQSIEKPAFEKAINDRLQSTSPGIAQSLIDLGNLVRTGFQARGVVVSVVWHYPDGSYATFVFDQTTQVWKRDPDLAFDSDDNKVPILRADYSGGDGGTRVYDFSPGSSSYDDFVRHAINVGVTFTNGTKRSPTQHTGVTCATTGTKTTCRVETLSY